MSTCPSFQITVWSCWGGPIYKLATGLRHLALLNSAQLVVQWTEDTEVALWTHVYQTSGRIFPNDCWHKKHRESNKDQSS
jgi:hypothetical protein